MLGLGIVVAAIAITFTYTPNSVYQNFIRDNPFSYFAKFAAMILCIREDDKEFAKEIVSTYPNSEAAIALYILIPPNEIKIEWTKNVIRYNEHGNSKTIWYPHSGTLLADQNFLAELILDGKQNNILKDGVKLLAAQNFAKNAENDPNFAKKVILDIYASVSLIQKLFNKHKKVLLQDLKFSKDFLELAINYNPRKAEVYQDIYDNIVASNIFQLTTTDKTFAEKFVEHTMIFDGTLELVQVVGTSTQKAFETMLTRYTDPFLIMKTSVTLETVEISPHFYATLSFPQEAVRRMWNDKKTLLTQDTLFLKQALTAEHFPSYACSEIKEMVNPSILIPTCVSLQSDTSCSMLACPKESYLIGNDRALAE